MTNKTLKNTNVQKELKRLWGGGKVPPLTPEQVELSLKLWQKIKARRQLENKVGKESITHQK